MPVDLDDIMKDLPAERREKIERMADAIAIEHRTLAQVRKALGVTQAKLADALETSQANVAQIEAKADVMVSTLARVVSALGGKLQLLVELPGQAPVALQIGTAAGQPVLRQPRAKKHPRTKAAPATAVPAFQKAPQRRLAR